MSSAKTAIVGLDNEDLAFLVAIRPPEGVLDAPHLLSRF
jgi:hypothetical protein